MGKSKLNYIDFLKKISVLQDTSISNIQSQLQISVDEIEDNVKAINAFNSYIKKDHDKLILEKEIDSLDKDYIFNNIEGNSRVIIFNEIDSTNNIMFEHINNIAPFDIVSCEMQTKGRGRLNNKWVAAPFSNLCFSFSVIVEDIKVLRGISVLAGISCTKALKRINNLDFKVKWPNDIYLNNGKFAGILSEQKRRADGKYVCVIGIGINVYNFSNSLNRKIVYLNEPNKIISRSDLLILLINELKKDIKIFMKEQLNPFIKIFNDVDYLVNKNIKVEYNNDLYEGIAKGITKTGDLILETENKRTYLSSGHIIFE